MNFFDEILGNSVLWTAIAAWFVAQLIKVILVLITTKKLDLRRMFGSGGMPSSHSAIVSALSVSVGMVRGFNSPEFAICAIVSFVVMYDASGVRRAAGRHAKILNKLMDKTASADEKLKELLGHSPLEVFAGAVLGILLAIAVYII